MNQVMNLWFGVDLSDDLWFAVELIPILLAITTIVVAGLAVNKNSGMVNLATIFSVITAFLLILAQGSWMSAHLQGIPYFKTVADNIWTIFNSLVMITLMMFAINNHRK